LFAALDLTRPGLEAVRDAVAAEDYGPAIWAWGDYFDTAKPEVWLFDPAKYKRFMEDHFPAFAQATLLEADALVRRTTTFFPWAPQAHTPEGEYDWFHTGQDQGRWINAEYLWSLHQLGRAFLLTGDPTYAQHFQDLFNGWYESLGHIPVHYAVHAEMLLGGQRSVRLLDGLYALRGTGLLRPRTHANALKALLGTCRLQYALNEFHTGHSGWKNAQYAAAGTLLTVAGMFPEFREAPAWRERGQQRLREHLFLDTYDDGGQLEPSTNYHETRLRDAFYAWCALQLNGQDPDFLAEIGPRLEKMCEFSFYTMTPTGHCLALMDGDHTEAHLVFLPLAADTFHRGDFAWLRDQFLFPDFCPTQGPLPALSSLFAADRTYGGALARVEAIQHSNTPTLQHSNTPTAAVPPTEPKWTSHFFPDTGVAIFRDSWSREARYASVYCGRSVASHAHHGFGFLELWAWGRPLFGSRGYGYHTTGDHAVAYLPGYEAPYTADVRQRFWRTGAAADVIALAHDGYRQSHETVCYRTVVFVKGSHRLPIAPERSEGSRLPIEPTADCPGSGKSQIADHKSQIASVPYGWPFAAPSFGPPTFPYFVVFDDLSGPLENIPARWGGITFLDVEANCELRIANCELRIGDGSQEGGRTEEKNLSPLIGRDRTQPDIGLLIQPAEPTATERADSGTLVPLVPLVPLVLSAQWRIETTTKNPPYDYRQFQAELPDLLERNTSAPQAYEQPAMRVNLETVGTATGCSFFVILAPFRVEPPTFEIECLAWETEGTEGDGRGRKGTEGEADGRERTPCRSWRVAAFAVRHAAGRDLFLFRTGDEGRNCELRIADSGSGLRDQSEIRNPQSEIRNPVPLGPWTCDADTVIITERDAVISVVASAATRLERDGEPILTGRRLQSLDLVLQPDRLDLLIDVDRYADLALPGPFTRLFVDGVEQPETLRDGAATLHFYKPGPHSVWALRVTSDE
jgi:hypothetical protein